MPRARATQVLLYHVLPKRATVAELTDGLQETTAQRSSHLHHGRRRLKVDGR